MATPDQLSMLQSWLEWAGAKLISTPGNKIFPQEYRTAWPEFSQNVWELTEFRRIKRIRSDPPSNTEIPLMEEILLLPNRCPDLFHRRVVHCRLLVHPVRGYYIFDWTKIAKILHADRKSVRRWHRNGLSEIWDKISDEELARISIRLSDNSATKFQ